MILKLSWNNDRKKNSKLIVIKFQKQKQKAVKGEILTKIAKRKENKIDKRNVTLRHHNKVKDR